MKILLAIDGSSCSDEAIREIGRRPWPEATEIHVLSAFELPFAPTPEGWSVSAIYLEEMDRLAREHAERVVHRAAKELKDKLGEGVSVEGKAVPGSPRAVILDEAEAWGADLIVVGSHGYRVWERFLLGSVSQSVVSHAKCSVEVVRCRKVGEEPRDATKKDS